MRPKWRIALAWALLATMVVACQRTPTHGGGDDASAPHALVGAWRTAVLFRTGTFAAVGDLEFMLVFNAGGTLTESSNYDAAPPVPPAYGIWRSVGEDVYEARYEYYATKAPGALDDLTRGGGWPPAGRGVFLERITLAADSASYTSTIQYQALDASGNPVAGGGEATGHGTRMRF